MEACFTKAEWFEEWYRIMSIDLSCWRAIKASVEEQVEGVERCYKNWSRGDQIAQTKVKKIWEKKKKKKKQKVYK